MLPGWCCEMKLTFMFITTGKRTTMICWFSFAFVVLFFHISHFFEIIFFSLSFFIFFISVLFSLRCHCESAIIVCGILLLVNTQRTNWIKNKTCSANDIAQANVITNISHCYAVATLEFIIFSLLLSIAPTTLKHSRVLVYYVNMHRECISIHILCFFFLCLSLSLFHIIIFLSLHFMHALLSCVLKFISIWSFFLSPFTVAIQHKINIYLSHKWWGNYFFFIPIIAIDAVLDVFAF